MSSSIFDPKPRKLSGLHRRVNHENHHQTCLEIIYEEILTVTAEKLASAQNVSLGECEEARFQKKKKKQP